MDFTCGNFLFFCFLKNSSFLKVKILILPNFTSIFYRSSPFQRSATIYLNYHSENILNWNFWKIELNFIKEIIWWSFKTPFYVNSETIVLFAKSWWVQPAIFHFAHTLNWNNNGILLLKTLIFKNNKSQKRNKLA